MKSLLLLLVIILPFKAFSAQYVDLSREEFSTLYHTMIVDTNNNEDNSPLAAMGGFPTPYLLIYSVKAQKFVSDNEKLLLLELGRLNGGTLAGVPLLVNNKPKGHHFFNHLSFEQLQGFMPTINKKSDYIVLYSGETESEAASTEELFMSARNGVKYKHHVELPILLAHIDSILDKKNWQVFKTIR